MVKSKEPVKLDQILKLLFSTSDKVLLGMLNSIFNENLSIENVKIIKSNNEFITQNLEDVKGDIFYEVIDSNYEKNLKFHIEFQTLKDNSMAIRMFEYGFQKAKESKINDEDEVIITFPKQRVIYIEENNNIKDNLKAKIILPDESEALYSIPVIKYWEYDDTMLIENKMYPLLPLQLFLLRKEIVKAIKGNNSIMRKNISKRILDLTWQLGNISNKLFNENLLEYEDYEKMLISIKSLVEYFKDNYIDEEILVKEANKMVKTLYDPEVEKRGIEKGIEKGIEQGELKVLIKLLDKKLNGLSESYKEKLSECNSELLNKIADDIFNLSEEKDLDKYFR